MANKNPQLEEIRALYRQAFRDFRAMALWNMRELKEPTPGHALAVARALRYEGNLDARRLAERIEALCHAVEQSAATRP
jgi:hypothetical protein